MSWEVLLVPAASWKIPFINNWYSSWNPRPPSSDQTVRVLDLFEYAGNYGPGGEKSMQIIIYEGCTTLPKAQNSFPLLLYNFGWKPVSGVYQLLELQCGSPVTNVINASEFWGNLISRSIANTLVWSGQIHLSAIWNSEADSVRNVINGWETR